jgi:hypothetical protein
MSAPYYRLLLVVAASVSLLIAGCGSDQPAPPLTADGSPKLAANMQKSVTTESDGMDTEATIFTVLGLAKRPSQRRLGPQVGSEVSPSLWIAAHDTLNFVPIASEDPLTGTMMTDWYSPKNKPNERLRVTVFILSYALRSDSLAVTIDREERGPDGQWKPSTVSRDVVTDLEAAILLRARQVHAESYRETYYAN